MTPDASGKRLVIVVNGNDVGNTVMATPLVASLAKRHDVYLLFKGDPHGIRGAFAHPRYVRDVYTDVDFGRRFRGALDHVVLTYMTEHPRSLRHVRSIVDTHFPGGTDGVLRPSELAAYDWTRIPAWRDKTFCGNEACYNLRVAAYLGIIDEEPRSFALWDEKVEFEEFDFAFHAGCKPGRWEWKRWPYFSELAGELAPRRIAVVGGPGDPAISWPANCVDFSAKLTFTETAALLRKCRMVVANDSGVFHLANALGVPAVAIWGWTGISKNKPTNPGATVIQLGLSCQPCYKRSHYMRCPGGRGAVDCLRDLTVSAVRDAVLEAWRHPPAGTQFVTVGGVGRSTRMDIAKVRVNVGCGADIRPGFLNIDCRPLPGVDARMDATSLGLPDGVADEVVAHDILEHFPMAETDRVLREWVRVLRPGGRLTIRCPDLRTISERYLSGAVSGGETARLLYGRQNYAENFHRAGFDRDLLACAIGRAGCSVTHVENQRYNLVVRARKHFVDGGAPTK